ncbi:hypothetical protein I862_00360 [endosymbiont of Acanthamoeba sp. UWC8]|uniref:host attachment protein n=1 Tax=endosymbiont of Acanthamoeba sp. UWC8 TaxID=86106 RepID=UPI0004D0DF32|nr:host attachment protein [endosymbiont of Acanthamoeba sp. UWC8]AIF80637.1 hypothetical protein I862_00360 [endosymbiont of Acanthamoeba sp. UWC8]
MSSKLIVVADAKNAIFYKAVGLKVTEQNSQINADEFNIAHKHPPRREGFNHIGSTPSHYFDPRSEFKSLERDDFCKEVVNHIDSVCNHEKFDELIIVAEPKTLGDIRSNLNPKLKTLVTKEISKDLIHADKISIENHVFSN